MTRKITITEDAGDVIDVTVPTVSAVVSVDSQRGPKGDTGPQGPQGDTGPQGPQGDPGVVTATAPITYDALTQTVGIDSAGYVASINGQSGSVSLAFDDLTDVDAPTPGTDDLVIFDGSDYVTTDAPTVDLVAFDVAAAETVTTGEVAWNDTDGTLDVGMLGGNVRQQVGMGQFVRAKHDTNGGITRGTVYYLTGATGGVKTVLPAQADAAATCKTTIGVAAETITGGGQAFITTFGLVRGLPDAQFTNVTEGTVVYLSATTPGAFTSTPPTPPDHRVIVGFCVRKQSNNNELFVQVQTGLDLNELCDVEAPSPTAGQVIAWDNADSRWENKTLAASDVGAAPATPTVGTSLGTTGTVNLDLSTLNGTYQVIDLTGNVTFTTSNLANGRTTTLILKESASVARTVTFPSWQFIGIAPPLSLNNEIAVVSLTAFGTNNTDVVASMATNEPVLGGITPQTRTISTSGTGLSGGGDLTADRTITLDPSALSADAAFTGAFTPLRLSLNTQSASYTLVAGDEQKLVEMDVAAANTLTVPPESSVSWATGTQIHVVQAGAGQTTLTPGSGVTINGTPGLKTRAQWSTVTLIYRGSDVWLAVGDLAA